MMFAVNWQEHWMEVDQKAFQKRLSFNAYDVFNKIWNEKSNSRR